LKKTEHLSAAYRDEKHAFSPPAFLVILTLSNGLFTRADQSDQDRRRRACGIAIFLRLQDARKN
jgi:hypothetical protein